MMHASKHEISRGFVLPIFVALALLFCCGCSSEKPPFADVYSDPTSGRIVDFGPQGLMAEKSDGAVIVGTWDLDDDQVSTLKITHPEAGKTFQAKTEVEEKVLRLRPPDSEIYETLVREPISGEPNEALIGLWKQVHDKSIDLYEFTPWGTCMWVRFADHTEEERIVGGWGAYRTPRPGRLGIVSGREFDYEIRGYDNYRFEIDKGDLVTTNSATKEVKRYQKIERSELKEISKKLLDFKPGPVSKKR